MNKLSYISYPGKMKPKSISFLSLVFFLLFQLIGNTLINAQPVPSGKIKELDEILTSIEGLASKEAGDVRFFSSKTDTTALRQLFSNDYAVAYQSYQENRVLDAKIQDLKRDPGLKFGAFYIENFKPGITDLEELIFIRRAYAEIGLDLLNGGLFQNKLKIKQLENEKNIISERDIKSRKEENYLFLYNYIIWIFNNEKLNIIDKRIKLLDEYITQAEKLYHLRMVGWEQVMALKGKKLEAEQIAENCRTYNYSLENRFDSRLFANAVNSELLPTLDIRPEMIIALSEDTASARAALANEVAIAELGNKRWQDMSLKPFFRYNMFTSEGMGTRYYGSVGVSFTAPLRLGRKADLKHAEADMILSHEEAQLTGKTNELLNNYYEYQAKLRSLVVIFNKYFPVVERIRKEKVRQAIDNPDYHPLHVLELSDDKTSLELEISDIRQSMYLKLLKIYTYLNTEDANSFTSQFKPGSEYMNYAGNRSIYLWSTFFKENKNEVLLEYLRNNQIKTLIISPNDAVAKAQAFIPQCVKAGISVQGMISNNQYAAAPDSAKVKKKIEEFYALGCEAVHFDIEPHTFQDWQARKGFYLNNLVSIMENARETCNRLGMKLALSIPIHYPEAVIEDLYRLSDQVYLMAYENPDVDFIAKKTAEEISISPEKTIIAIRTKDFESRLTMETFIEALTKKLNLQKIAIHDLGTLWDLDHNSVE